MTNILYGRLFDIERSHEINLIKIWEEPENSTASEVGLEMKKMR